MQNAVKRNDNKQIPKPLQNSNVIISSTKVTCHRKVKLTNAINQTPTKDELYKLCDDYTDIFLKHPLASEKKNLVQKILKPKDNIKSLD